MIYPSFKITMSREELVELLAETVEEARGKSAIGADELASRMVWNLLTSERQRLNYQPPSK